MVNPIRDESRLTDDESTEHAAQHAEMYANKLDSAESSNQSVLTSSLREGHEDVAKQSNLNGGSEAIPLANAEGLPRSGYRDERVREGNRLLDRRATPRVKTPETVTKKAHTSELDESDGISMELQPAWLSPESDTPYSRRERTSDEDEFIFNGAEQSPGQV